MQFVPKPVPWLQDLGETALRMLSNWMILTALSFEKQPARRMATEIAMPAVDDYSERAKIPQLEARVY